MTDIVNYSLDQLESGDGLTEINAVITQAQSALNNLSSRVDNQNSKEAMIRYHVPLATGTTAGMLVYYNTTNSNFAPAIAALLPSPGEQGQSIEAPSARVEGMIVDVDSSNTAGTLLIGGSWKSAACASACLGSTAVAGTYYLSPTSAGHAVLDPGSHLRQPVLSYHGNGEFSLGLFYMAHDNHFHSSATITGTWMLASELAAELGITVPTGAIYGYKHTADSAFTAIGELSSNITAIFYNGVLQHTTDKFIISDGYIWSKLATAPATNTVIVFNHYPFAYGSPVIRSLESTSDALTIITRNGISRLTAADYISGSTSKSALAVAALSGRTLLFTPVITDVVAGPGVTVDKDSLGTAVVASSYLVGRPIDAYSINHNGTTITSDGLFQYITYPKSRVAELVMTMPVQDVSDGTSMKAVTWAISAGSSATFAVKVYYLKLPTASSSVTIPTATSTPDLTTTMTLSGESGKFTYSESAGYMTFSGDGTLVAVVSAQNAPGTDIRLLRMGFKLTVAAAQTTEEEDTPEPETTTAVTGAGTAGESIDKYNLVYADTSGALRRCTSQEAARLDTCLGVALSAASSGDSLTYMIAGILQDTNFYSSLGFTPSPGQALYVGTTGLPTQTSPSTTTGAAYVQRIGTALTGAALQINISAGVLKES